MIDTNLKPTEPVYGPGWAIQRVGPWVLGHWDVPLNPQRVAACARLYRAAVKEHGRLIVLAVFAGMPFEPDMLIGQKTRRDVTSLFTEVRSAVTALIFPLEGSGILAAVMRSAAAGVVLALPFRLPIFFPSDYEEGLRLARERGLFDLVSEDVIRGQLAELRAIARGERPGAQVSSVG